MAFSDNAGNFLSGGYKDATSGLNEFIPEIWGSALQDSFDKKLVMTGLGSDWSPLVATSGDYIRLPLVEDMGTGTVSNANALDTSIVYTDNTAGASKVAITINQHSYSAGMVEDLTIVQSSYDLVSTFTERMASALALKVDDYLENLVNDALDTGGTMAGNETDGGTAPAITFANFGNLLTSAMSQDANLDNWYIVVNSSAYGKLFAVSEFVTAGNIGNQQGGVAPSIVNGFVGMLGGIKVVMSNNVQSTLVTATTAISGYLLHKSALNFAFSIKPRVQTQYSIDNLSTKVVADVAYGGAIKGGTADGKKTAFAIV